MNRSKTAVPTDGFMAEAAENWRRIHNRRASDWFDLARDLNQFGHKLKASLEAQAQPTQQHLFAGALLYLRALTTFQAAVLVAGYGLVADAGTLVRSCLEDFFLLVRLNEDHNFVARMMQSDALQEKRKLKGFLSLPPDLGVAGDRAKKLSDYLDKFPNDLSDINFREISREAGVWHMYETYYRGLSHTSAHPNIQALMRHALFDDSGNVTGFSYGPDASKEQLSRIIAFACAIFHCVNQSAITLFDDDDQLQIHNELYRRYSELARRDFPDIE